MAAIDLLARAICPPGTYYSRGGCYRNSSWYYWGRWVLAGVVILLTILVIFAICCVRSRRQRKHGRRPMYGTGWMAPGKFAGQHPQQQQQWGGGGAPPAPPPPPYGGYGQQHQQAGYNNAASPYGQQREYYSQADGVQQPQSTYQPVYSPPAGPPPGK